MARAYLTDRQMPKRFWFYALRHAAQVMNYCPGHRSGSLTSPFELAHGCKPDLRVLFRLFSIGFFRHCVDSNRARTQFEAQTLTGIAIGRSADSNAMEFFHPITNAIYTSADYRLDSGQTTAATFPQLRYDGGLVLGLYISPSSTSEPFPPHREVFLLHEGVLVRGFFQDLPIPSADPTTPTHYTVRLATVQLVPSS
jgi:hypothetical protein